MSSKDETCQPAPFLVVRTPLLPFHTLKDLSPPLISSYSDRELERRRAELTERVRAQVENPEVMDAIAIASRSLYAQLRSWRSVKSAGKEKKLVFALFRYLARMSYRCTPFGLFAGVGFSEFDWCSSGQDVGIRLSARTLNRRVSRIDLDVLARVAQSMETPGAIPHLRYFANPTLRRVGPVWHYIESRYSGGRRSFKLSSVEDFQALSCVLEHVQKAEDLVRLSDISGVLTRHGIEVADEEARDFAVELVRNQVLLTNLEPTITGESSFQTLTEELAKCGLPVSETLSALGTALKALDGKPVGQGAEDYLRLDSQIRSLTDDTIKDTLQVDLCTGVESAKLPRYLVESLTTVATVLARLWSGMPPELDEFKKAFYDRYGNDYVPLLEALDPELGIPFGNTAWDEVPLLKNVPKAVPVATSKGHVRPLDALLAEACARAIETGAEEYELTQDTLDEAFMGRPINLPSSFALLSTILPGSDHRNWRAFVRAASGPSAGSLISRFCPLDERLDAAAKALLRHDDKEYEGKALAEIVHWPEARASNVVRRSSLRSYELPIFGRSALPKDRQIALSDLLVGLEHGRLRLKTKSSGQYVLPRLTSAHAFRNPRNISIYKFLSTLQHHDGAFGLFVWPDAFKSVPRTPRIVYGNCILALQTWNLTRKQLVKLGGLSANDAFRQMQEWRSQMSWPRFIELVDGDNCLPVDLDNPLSIDVFVDEVAGRWHVAVREILETEHFVSGPDGGYTNEVVLPFTATVKMPPEEAPAASSTGIHRPKYEPGSEWIYIKLYLGTLTADRVLRDYIQPVVTELVNTGDLERWFFIRYSDPDYHLRLRFKLHSADEVGSALATIRRTLRKLWDSGLVSKTDLSTYEPEVDRYGGPSALDSAETIFRYDSDCVLELLGREELLEPEHRALISIESANGLWSALGHDTEARRRAYESAAAAMRPNATNDKGWKIALDRKYRDVKPMLDKLFHASADSYATKAFATRDRHIQAAIARLRALAERGELTRPLESIWRSHVHMAINRLAVSSNTAQEAVIYEMLYRWYRTEALRHPGSAIALQEPSTQQA